MPILKFLLLAGLVVLCACASTIDEDGALATVPYRMEDNRRIVIEARVNDRGPFRFALDTGASISVIFDALRDKLELQATPGRSVYIHGAVASGRFPLLSIDRLQIGSEIWAGARVVSLPGNTVISAGIDGILGVDFLQKYAVGFSAEHRVVRLYPPELVSRRAYRGWAAVPLDPVYVGESRAALYFFEISSGHQRIRAFFDLGAGLNMVNWPAADSLGLPRVWPEDEAQFAGAIEDTPIVASFRAQEVRTAGIRWRNEVFSVADLGIFETLPDVDIPMAILGAGLFNQRDFVIDYLRDRLLVKVAMDEADDD